MKKVLVLVATMCVALYAQRQQSNPYNYTATDLLTYNNLMQSIAKSKRMSQLHIDALAESCAAWQEVTSTKYNLIDVRPKDAFCKIHTKHWLCQSIIPEQPTEQLRITGGTVSGELREIGSRYPQKALHVERLDGVWIDPRDNKTYKTVKIGTQTWMAENLNYEAEGSVCYENNPANCAKCGRLYNWDVAMKACPSGWHLPSKDEYETLDKAVGGEKVAGKKLKAKSGWNSNGNGSDEYGFSALPGGSGNSSGDFINVGYYGLWWSASEDEDYSDYAYYRYMDYNLEFAYWSNINKSVLFSVRCLQD